MQRKLFAKSIEGSSTNCKQICMSTSTCVSMSRGTIIKLQKKWRKGLPWKQFVLEGSGTTCLGEQCLRKTLLGLDDHHCIVLLFVSKWLKVSNLEGGKRSNRHNHI
eukprot:1871731-Amphidinium_carterae.1